jgi:hypothetical protein
MKENGTAKTSMTRDRTVGVSGEAQCGARSIHFVVLAVFVVPQAAKAYVAAHNFIRLTPLRPLRNIDEFIYGRQDV